MAKPKTKGAPIQVRLPLELDAAVRVRAKRRKITPAAFIEIVVAGSHDEGWVDPIGTGDEVVRLPELKRPQMTITTDDPTCTHPKSKRQVTSSSGLHRCSCGAIRGVDGTWR